MKLFRHSSGMIVAFGFDMQKRVADPNMITWSDPDGKTWEPALSNAAGSVFIDADIDPDFVYEARDFRVVAFQAGICIEMLCIGSPFIWQTNVLRAAA